MLLFFYFFLKIRSIKNFKANTEAPINVKIPPKVFIKMQITVTVFTELYKSSGRVKSLGKTKPTIKRVIPQEIRIIDSA